MTFSCYTGRGSDLSLRISTEITSASMQRNNMSTSWTFLMNLNVPESESISERSVGGSDLFPAALPGRAERDMIDNFGSPSKSQMRGVTCGERRKRRKVRRERDGKRCGIGRVKRGGGRRWPDDKWCGGKRIGNDGKIACANKSARETGQPESAQNGAAMAGISGHPAAARVFAK
ncbi:hypothetical protein B0H14DRAFT_2638386 [Mycena olivaceomarginata]|nr:hypothetical protein B0H14DRAFT_2638386 [Mycena olivaceomarginata]